MTFAARLTRRLAGRTLNARDLRDLAHRIDVHAVVYVRDGLAEIAFVDESFLTITVG